MKTPVGFDVDDFLEKTYDPDPEDSQSEPNAQRRAIRLHMMQRCSVMHIQFAQCKQHSTGDAG